jgi:hypothetical protein
VQPFEDRHQVIPAGHARPGGIGDSEGDPAGHPGLPGVALGGGNHVGIQVETVHPNQRVGQRHGDG